MGGLPEGVRELDHTADLGIEIVAPDAGALFDRAARALRALAVDEGDAAPEGGGAAGAAHAVDGSFTAWPEPPVAGGAGLHTLELEASDAAVLLVRWLSELLYRIDTLGLAYQSAELAVEGGRLHARIRETRLPEAGAHIKAVTYHGLECGPLPDGSWGARVIFDV
jgi:SHS2 domain-containing protein